MVAAVLKQIFLRASKGTRASLEEMQVIRDALTDSNHDDQIGNLITRIALAVAPAEGDTHEEQVASKLEFAAKHLASLQGFLDRRLTVTQLEDGAAILQGLAQMLQARHTHTHTQCQEKHGIVDVYVPG